MRDSFNNRLEVGDRILCLESTRYNTHRKNQLGTVAKINGDGMVVEFDSYHSRGGYYPDLDIQYGYGNSLFKSQDKFIKLETHTEVEYRVGDKVLCYYTTVSNIPFVGTVVQDIEYGEEYSFLEEGGFFMKQSHIFGSPFYYIDYTLAQVCAFD